MGVTTTAWAYTYGTYVIFWNVRTYGTRTLFYRRPARTNRTVVPTANNLDNDSAAPGLAVTTDRQFVRNVLWNYIVCWMTIAEMLKRK